MKNWKKDFVSAAKIEAVAPKTVDGRPKTADGSETRLVKVGAMWKKTTKAGDPMFGIDIRGASLMAFENSFKESDKQPDYIIYSRAGEEDGRL